VIYTWENLLRLENLEPKKFVWLRFHGGNAEAGSKIPTKRTLSHLSTQKLVLEAGLEYINLFISLNVHMSFPSKSHIQAR
jgi:hypothetical protein